MVAVPPWRFSLPGGFSGLPALSPFLIQDLTMAAGGVCLSLGELPCKDFRESAGVPPLPLLDLPMVTG